MKPREHEKDTLVNHSTTCHSSLEAISNHWQSCRPEGVKECDTLNGMLTKPSGKAPLRTDKADGHYKNILGR